MIHLEKYQKVREDAMCGAGMSLTLRGVLSVIDTLANTFGDDFEIDKACDALDLMIEWADILKKELRKPI